MIRKDLRAPLATRCPHRAIFHSFRFSPFPEEDPQKQRAYSWVGRPQILLPLNVQRFNGSPDMPQISSREEEPLPLEESCTLAVEPNTSYIATYALIFYLVIWGPAQLKGIVATF